MFVKNQFFLSPQTKNDRSGFSDYKTLSCMTWEDKNKVPQCSKIVVTVSNWHFNRNTLKQEKAPICKLENVMVTLKLSSTVFESGTPASAAADDVGSADDVTPAVSSPGAATNGSGGAATSQSGETYNFDKNGAIIPYSAFVSLLDSEDFQDYLRTVKRLYKGKDIKITPPRPVFASSAGNKNTDDDDDEEEEVVVVRAKKRRSDFVKKMREGKAKKVIEFESEDDNSLTVEPNSQSEDLGVTPLPSEDEEENDSNEKNAEEEEEEDADRNKETKSGGGGHKEEKKPKETKDRKK